jgi:cyclase
MARNDPEEETTMRMDRRQFVKLSALGIAAAGLPRPLGATGWQRRDVFTPIRRNVGIYTARGGTIGWLVNDSGVIVVDSQFPDTAATFLAGLRERSSRPIDALVNSHHHGDHTGGNAVIRETARMIVAHERVPELQRAAALQRGGEDGQAYPDTTFADSWSVEIGDERVRAKHYGRAHTGGDSTIFFERANVVHMGDLMFNRMFPFVDGPAGASVAGWIEVLEAVVRDHDADTLYVFGHSDPAHELTGRAAELLYQRDFLTALLDVARRGAREGASREEVTRTERIPGFDAHSGPQERLGVALGVAYDEVAR